MPHNLFEPLRLGAIDAPTRIVMAPMTRGRSTRAHVPTDIMIEYYTQRATAGLIITEATGISQQGLGWPYAPGIWNAEQTQAWRKIVDAVHAKGGRIVCQLWHMGRIVHPDFLGGEAPVSASATTAPDKAYTYDGQKPFEPARELRKDEIPGLLEDYRNATRNALAAGFDGVQIHAANGYLIDQFLRDGTNLRTDEYGGSIENRIRLLDEITRAVVSVGGAERVGVRLSPNGAIQGVNDSNPEPLFTAAAKRLQEIGISYLELREPPQDGSRGKPDHPAIAPAIRNVFRNPLILNSDYDMQRAEQTLVADEADAIAFGRPFISNPDLPHRFLEQLPLAESDEKTWYAQGPQGYTDYPAANATVGAAS